MARMPFAAKCDVVGVEVWDIMLSERYVWFEFTGVVEGLGKAML